MAPTKRFRDGEELRSTAEAEYGRVLSPEEWKRVDPGDNYTMPASFGPEDLRDLVNGMNETLGGSPKRGPWDTARTRVKAEALFLEESIKAERRRIFDSAEAPFSSNEEAVDWLSAQVTSPERTLVALTVEVPVTGAGIQSVLAVRDTLNRLFPEEQDHLASDTDFYGPRPKEIRRVGYPVTTVRYYIDHGDGTAGMTSYPAPPGSLLERVAESVSRVARESNWEEVDILDYLLTGSTSTYLVRSTTNERFTNNVTFAPQLTMTVIDPFTVSDEELLRLFHVQRDALREAQSFNRTRTSSRNYLLVPFVMRTREQGLTWADTFEAWNAENPDMLYRSQDAFKSAYYRQLRQR